MDLGHELLDQLTWYWDAHARPRLDGLTDDEHFWEPVHGCWSVRHRADAVGGQACGAGEMVVDFELPEPDPPPYTTIAWRLAHVTVVFDERLGRHLAGPATSRSSAVYAVDAAGALDDLDRACALWIDAIRDLDDDALARPIGPKEPFPDAPMAGLILHIHREVIHHLAEVLVAARPLPVDALTVSVGGAGRDGKVEDLVPVVVRK
jgi:DinB superfamily